MAFHSMNLSLKLSKVVMVNWVVGGCRRLSSMDGLTTPDNLTTGSPA
jgi:hypothetical protein